MRVCTKKVYCKSCGVLVGCKEQAISGGMKISCAKCGKVIRTKDGPAWKPVHETA